MERCGGVELGKIWNDMPWKDRLEIVRTLVAYEKAYVSANFPMYGSLYYAKDLPSLDSSQYLGPHSSEDKETAFVIGPTTKRAFFDQGRDAIEQNRGPCKSYCLPCLAHLHLTQSRAFA